MNQISDIDASLLGPIDAADGSLTQSVYKAIRTAILRLDFPPGAVLRKGPICAHLGVSRAPISDAVARLAAEGLVDVRPQAMTRVAYFSMPEIREGSFLREALELATVARLAGKLQDEQRIQIQRNLRMQELLADDQDIRGFHQADEEFHALLMAYTGFQRLPLVTEQLSLQVNRARLLMLPSPGRVRETLAEHRAIVAAIDSGDAHAAQQTMRHHLSQMMPRLEALEGRRPDLFGPDTPIPAKAQHAS